MTPTRATKSELSRRLKLHRHRLDALLAKPGAPSPDKKKTYAVAEIVEFVKHEHEAGVGTDVLRAARLREVNLRCELLSREIKRADGESIDLDKVNAWQLRVGLTLKGMLFDGCENTLPPRLEGLSAVEIRKILRDFADSICERMSAPATWQ
jgi:hypothetical protein